ncbi:MAG: aminotransferase class I/II-fold pyridoxal phosphate-dependent enzyme [Clostridia bacterium]|nr:aminotransferase class I/II-fold pyridoxal phosphate-dependent enzyme [Clostridia bacterium]
MKYDFQTKPDRRGMDAVAVDTPEGLFPPVKEGFAPIPMWIADMNFPVLPSIQDAIIARVKHPSFGYFQPREEYYASIIRWQERRNGVRGLEKKHIGYENGVLGGVVTALNVFCSRGDKVLLHAPTYVGFTGALGNNGYDMVLSPLKRDEKGIWRMDFRDMEEKLSRERIHAAVFCNPHNPTGRVWERWELEEAMELFRKYGVYVVSDEIWSDILLDGRKHIPLQSVSEDAAARTAAFYAPSKTFNLAGLVGSYHIVYNDWIRERMEKESSLGHYNSMNLLSMYALIGAYREEGYEWVDELCTVLSENVRFAVEYIRDRFRGVSVSAPEGTYMLFPDCAEWCREHGSDVGALLKKGQEVGVLWQDGRAFHGETHIRMNLALPKRFVEEAFDRLDKYVFNA